MALSPLAALAQQQAAGDINALSQPLAPLAAISQQPVTNVAPATGLTPSGYPTGAPQQPNTGGVLNTLVSPLARLTPDVLKQALGLDTSTAPAIDPNYIKNTTSLANKYKELGPQLAQLPADLRNTLINYDASRVSQGSAPLTKAQTSSIIQTQLTGKQATPEPTRSPLSVLDNVRGDLSTILKSIPRLPLALIHEVQDLPRFPQILAANEAKGMNPIAALANSPGIRLIPGAYTVGNLARGASGIREELSHPLQSALDVLPIAHGLAGATDAGKLATSIAEEAGQKARPINAFLANKVATAEDGTQSLARNALGRTFDTLRDDTKLGQALDAFGGKRNRLVASLKGELQNRYRSVFAGYAIPEGDVEQLSQRAGTTLSKYADQYPFLGPKATSPADAAARADLYANIQRDPTAFNPAMVNELRDLNEQAAKIQAAQGLLGNVNGEWFDKNTADTLQRRQSALDLSRGVNAARNEYLAPSGQLTADNLRAMWQDASSLPTPSARTQYQNAVMATMDAYGLDPSQLRTARAAMRGKFSSPADLNAVLDDVLQQPLAPRRSLTQVNDILRQRDFKSDSMVGRLQQAIKDGQRGDISRILRNLYDRKPPSFSDAEYAGLREDIGSLARRQQFDVAGGAKHTEDLIARRTEQLANTTASNAPARFHGLIQDATKTAATEALTSSAEKFLGRRVTGEEAANISSALLQSRWSNIPGLSADEASTLVKQVRDDTARTWQDLKAAGHDPLFVHKVSTGRATAAVTGNIGPIPTTISQIRERALDLTPGVQDLQVSLTHQAGEMLTRQYNEQFADQVLSRLGKTEAQIREELAPIVERRAARNPTLDYEGHMQAAISRAYEKFNVEEAGKSWGGAKLDKYRQDDYYIPKSVSYNLKQYAKPPSLFTSAIEPINKIFKYNVIGLSPSTVINNFFSNAVAVTAESGPGAFRYWNEARQWLKDPSLIPDERLKGMIAAETPHIETLDRGAWLKSRTGEKVMQGFNAGKAFNDSAILEGAKKGLSALDSLAEKNMRLQQLGDGMARAMQYMDVYERGLGKGKTAAQAADAAIETVRKTLVDFSSFTPIERSAMRTIVPFYSYMGHAARYVMRYPLDHPIRASVMAHLADAERERLGTLPGSWLSMLPIGGVDDQGHQNVIPLRPFDAFGDISNMLSVSGWLSATNPVLQTALQQAGVIRGEAELYPTMRYDPETGRMVAEHGNFLSDLFTNVAPRAGLLTAALGVNSEFNDAKTRDPDAAKRLLLTAAGLPKLWRSAQPILDTAKGEVAREKVASTVQNAALRSGNWTDAARYSSLQQVFQSVKQLPPAAIQNFTPAQRQQLALVTQEIVKGNGG